MDRPKMYNTRLGIGCGCLCVGMAIGGYLGWYMNKPNSVYLKDLNGDNETDIIVKTNRKDIYPFIHQTSGRKEYKRLDELNLLDRTSVDGISIEAKLEEFKE